MCNSVFPALCMQYELAVGKSPYPDFETPFQRIEYIVDKEAPQLTDEVELDQDCRDFINHWCVPPVGTAPGVCSD